MWPLFCNEIGLSYDQEEKVRNFQRQLLQDEKTWLDRHTGLATKKVVSSAHDAVQALTLRAGQRERSTASILSPEQRAKLLSWSTRNRHRMAQATAKVPPPYTSPLVTQREPSTQNHVSANLYILNERLSKVLDTVSRAAPLVTGKRLKKLSRRPCFESIGSCDENPMRREDSCGSLKRNASEMSMDCESEEGGKHHVPPICPVDAQAKAAQTVQQALSFVQDLLPPAPEVVTPDTSSNNLMAAYIPTAAAPPAPGVYQEQQLPTPAPVFSYQGSYHQSAPTLGSLQPATQDLQNQQLGGHHQRRSSFLPAHLNVVPEEMWPGDEAEEFLLGMIDGDDWAIGEGIDMDNM